MNYKDMELKYIDFFLGNKEENVTLQKGLMTDPVTIWVIVQTSAAVIGATASVISAISSYRQLKQIIDKLNEIIGLQKQILDEVRSLKVYFDQALYNAFVTDISNDLSAQVMRYEVIIGGLPDDNEQISDLDKQRLASLLNEVEQTSFKLLSYGPAAYQGASIGIIILKSLYFILNISENSQKVAFKKFAEKTFQWNNDPNIGIIKAIQNQQVEVEKATDDFNKSLLVRVVDQQGYDFMLTSQKVVGSLDTDLVLMESIKIDHRAKDKWVLAKKDKHKVLLNANGKKQIVMNMKENKNKLFYISSSIETLNHHAINWT